MKKNLLNSYKFGYDVEVLQLIGCSMRIIVCILLLWCGLLQAENSTIKSLSTKGKHTYQVVAGTFADKAHAEELLKTLSALSVGPVHIEYLKKRKLYRVAIGPLEGYKDAQAVEKKINQKELSLPASIPADTNTPLKSSIANAKPPAIDANQKAPQSVVESKEKREQPPANNDKIWNLRNAEIRAVIGEVSRLTGKNFLIDPRVQGKISIISNTPMNNHALYQVFLSMLQVSGYSAIPSKDVIKIIPALDAKTMASEGQQKLHGEDMMVRVIHVKYVPADQMVPVLRPLMPQSSNVSAYAPSNALILSGQANNINRLSSIISQVDSSSVSDIDFVPLKHTLAMDIVNTLKDLTKTQPNGMANTQTTIAADDRGNAILISGSKTERLKLRLLISHLDKRSSNSTDSNTQVIYLNYLRAEDLVPILAGIAQANFTGIVGTTIGTITRPVLDSTNPASSLANNQGGTPTAQSLPQPIPANANGTANTQNEGSTKPIVQIIAEPNTNSIIVNAPITLIRTLKKVIAQLDIKPAQLLIEALVAEINETDFNNLGIEWGSIDQKTLENDTFRAGFAILNTRTTIDQFEAQIFALAREHKANILSTPSVVVLDNRQAKILIGKQVSVASSSYPNNGGGTTTASPYTTFDRVNVALHLYVRPQITRGNGIQMQIDQGNDTLDAVSSIDPGTNPTFNISSIVTSVHVESGDIVVLGGLTQDSVTKDGNNVPIIGDIPGVGQLFRRYSHDREKKVLMVFIKPRILRTERDAVAVTGEKYYNTRQDQLKVVREQDYYDPRNSRSVLKPLQSAQLPLPFNHAPTPIVPTK